MTKNVVSSLEAQSTPARLLHFTYLQILDVMTTLAFLMQGVGEANPLVRAAIELAPSPLLGLVMVKSAAVLLAIYCWRAGRGRLLLKANVFFAILILWNLSAMVIRAAH